MKSFQKAFRSSITVLLLCACMVYSCQHAKLHVGESHEAITPDSQDLKPPAKQHIAARTPQSLGTEMVTSSSDTSPDTQQDTLTNLSRSVAGLPQGSVAAATHTAITKGTSDSSLVKKRPASPLESAQVVQSIAAKQAKKEAVSPAHKAWFTSFTQAVSQIEQDLDNEASWDVMEDVLSEGAKHDFLTKSIVCPNDNNPATDYEYTPLHYVAARGLLTLVKELVTYEKIPVNIQTKGNKNTPLHLAASRGEVDVVEFLLAQGADPNLVDDEESSALHYAAAGRDGEMNREVIECLVKNGADIKKFVDKNTSMLDMAVIAANIPVIEYWEDNYANSLDPDIDVLTKAALRLAKYRYNSYPAERNSLAEIIRILKKILKDRQDKHQDTHATK